jgi:hypothetical protein
MKTKDLTSIGIWTWLMIVEKQADKLDDSGKTALKLLRESLERLANENQS